MTLLEIKHKLCFEKWNCDYRTAYLRRSFPELFELTDESAELYATSKVDDYKSRLRDEVEKAIKELEEMELTEFGNGRKRELMTILELIDSLRP